MSENDKYLISRGELSADRWEVVLEFLGSQGVTTERILNGSTVLLGRQRVTAAEDDGGSTTAWSEVDGGITIDIPISLAAVTNDSQFVGREHFVEFWEVYRFMPNEKKSYTTNRGEAVELGLSDLQVFRVKKQPQVVDGEFQHEYMRQRREAAGLVMYHRHNGLIVPSEATWPQASLHRSVIQARGLIAFVQSYEERPVDEQVLTPKSLAFMRAFIKTLTAQIIQADPQYRLPT